VSHLAVHRSTARDASDNSPHVTAGEGASIGFLARWLSGIAPSASGRLDSAARWTAKARSAPDHPPTHWRTVGGRWALLPAIALFRHHPSALGRLIAPGGDPLRLKRRGRQPAKRAQRATCVTWPVGPSAIHAVLIDEKRLRRRTRAHGVLRLVASAFPACGATPTSAAGALSKSGTAPFATCPYEAPTGACAVLESLVREFLAGGTNASQRETCTHSGADAPFIGRRAAPPGTRIRGPARGVFKVTRRSSR
jgi:hypothetical protein